MKYSSRRRRLFCHYCNNKSDLIYNEPIPQWECKKCDAINYLDENGDIRDPPVAKEAPLPLPVRYTIPSSQASTDPSTSSSIFCELCLKNQRLYTSSLAQYHTDVDIDDPDHFNIDDGYLKFQKDLQKRYPQVCEKCKPAALRRIKEAGKTAKADYLRRLMDKTRENRSSTIREPIFTMDKIGRFLWNFGSAGQLIWNIATLSIISLHNFFQKLEISYSIFMPEPTRFMNAAIISRTWAFGVLMSSLISIWWCPKYKESNKSFSKIIAQFKVWYYFQLFLISLRVAFYYVMCNSFLLSNFTSSITLWAHLLMVALNIIINSLASNSLLIDRTPLWDSKLEKINLSPQLKASQNGSESMEDILDEIVSTTNRGKYINSCIGLDTSSIIAQESTVSPQKFRSNELGPSLTSDSALSKVNTKTQSSLQNIALQNQLGHSVSALDSNSRLNSYLNPLSHDNSGLRLPARTTPSLLEMSEEEATRYLQTGETPHDQLFDEMDWQSTQPHREFHPRSKVPIKQYNQTPTLESSPFWYKIPPAPVTPAQRLRNPTNRSSIEVPSTINKQNFFCGLNSLKTNNHGLASENKIPKNTKENFVLSQPKFFPPENLSEPETVLADLFTGITLDNSEDSGPNLPHLSKFHKMIRNFTLAALIPIIIFSFCTVFKFY